MKETFCCHTCLSETGAAATGSMCFMKNCDRCGRNCYCLRLDAEMPATGVAAKTRGDVERLKKSYLDDPWDDIELTTGFEAFRDELKAFREEQEKAWSEDRERKVRDHALHIAASLRKPINARDEFAMAALNGILASEGGGELGSTEGNARAAYAYADAMLMERLKESKP